MKSAEKIIRALETFPGRATILYDSSSNEVVTFQNVIDFIAEQKAEIERLTEELNLSLDIKETIGVIGKQTAELLSENENLLKENAELQKQVDELKEENSILSITVELHDKIEEQAVKDTAQRYHNMMNEIIEKRDYVQGYAEIGLKEENDEVLNKIMEGVDNEQ